MICSYTKKSYYYFFINLWNCFLFISGYPKWLLLLDMSQGRRCNLLRNLPTSLPSKMYSNGYSPNRRMGVSRMYFNDDSRKYGYSIKGYEIVDSGSTLCSIETCVISNENSFRYVCNIFSVLRRAITSIYYLKTTYIASAFHARPDKFY